MGISLKDVPTPGTLAPPQAGRAGAAPPLPLVVVAEKESHRPFIAAALAEFQCAVEYFDTKAQMLEYDGYDRAAVVIAARSLLAESDKIFYHAHKTIIVLVQHRKNANNLAHTQVNAADEDGLRTALQKVLKRVPQGYQPPANKLSAVTEAKRCNNRLIDAAKTYVAKRQELEAATRALNEALAGQYQARETALKFCNSVELNSLLAAN